ncbi:MAG: arginyltransferase [Alphaproteobacteria bacterium]
MSTTSDHPLELTSASLPFAQQMQIFYRTAGSACPYLQNRIERHVLTDLYGPNSGLLYDSLTAAGFRRSHHLIYRPACSGCSACIPVRIVTEKFKPSRTQRRIMKINRDLHANVTEASATHEQFDLFMRYQKQRHSNGDMARMTFDDFRFMIEGSPITTYLVEFRTPTGTLVACCLTDRVNTGLSAVYSFFDPDQPHSSLGTLVILWLINKARYSNLAYVYLGYWVRNSPKMSYKAHFNALEYFTQGHWHSYLPVA